MRIACPYCGARDIREFSYLGEAVITRGPIRPTRKRSRTSPTTSIAATILPGRCANTGITRPAARPGSW